MEKIEKIIKLGITCAIMIVCIGKMQNQIVTESSSIQSEKQTYKNQKENVQASNENVKDDTEPDSESDSESKAENTGNDATDTSIEANAQNSYPIIGENGVTLSQMVSFFRSSGHPYPSEALGEGGAPTIEDYCQIFLDESSAEGIRAEIPYVQSMKETGWLQFEGVCDIHQYNFAGLGATGGDVAGESYPDVRTGIRAQIQHLKAYATEAPLEGTCVDSRYALVQKASAPYVQWLGQQENPGGYGWATAPEYGISIAEMIQNLKTF